MTSRNSFLARLLENSKRRLWLIVIAILLFVVAIPIYTAMSINIIEARVDNLGMEKMLKQLYSNMEGMFAFNTASLFFGGGFAVLAGIQGFSYLYDRSKIDFYHSKPVKASNRFFTIWLNGVLIYAIPYVIGSALNLLLAASSGVMDTALFLTWCEGIVLSVGYYLTMYSIVILAVMLTGKPLITIMGICVFLFYEMAVRALFLGWCSFSFHFFYGYSEDDWYIPFLSPFKIVYLYAEDKTGLIVTLLLFIAFASAVLALAYWCYKKRPSELAGSAMTFNGIKPFIKIGVAVPVALVAGLATAGFMDYDPLDGSGSPFFPILLGALFLLLACGLIQVIFEADIRGMFHKKRDIIISAVLALAIMLVFRYDLVGYDNRVPAFDKIESVSIVTPTEQRYYSVFYDENMVQLTKEEFADKYMRLVGEDAENVRQLALLSIEKYQEYPNRDAYYDENPNGVSVCYKFRLKNGGVVAREIPVNSYEADARAIIEKIEMSENFIRYNEPALSEYFVNAVGNGMHQIDAAWGNDMMVQDLTTKQTIEILKLYQEDLLKNSYEARVNDLPVGEITISLDQKVSYNRRVNFSIYPSFTNCMDYLKENGFETEKYVNIEDIDRITIRKYYETQTPETEYIEKDGYIETVAVSAESKTCTVDYTDKASIQAVIDSAYPGSLDWDYWYRESPYDDNDYGISIYFKPDTDYYEEYGSVGDMNFLKDKIPDFVLEELPREAPIE